MKTTGKVTWFNVSKGYGFIQSQGKEIFVHYTAILDKKLDGLREGQTVEFDLEDKAKGLQAFNVSVKGN